MRFFAHDGRAVHGPSAPEELIKLPGFDGDTLVCPVGSADSADWKPALAYPPFREALLSPAPKSAPPPSPLLPPPPPAPTEPCPACGHANPEDARFCNACAARMDGREEPPPPAAPPAPAPAAELVPLPAPEPVPDFSLPSEFALPPEPALEPFHEPVPEPAPPQPVEAFAPVPETHSFQFDPLAFTPEPTAETPVAETATPPARTGGPLRKTLVASFIGAVIAGGGLGCWLLRPAHRSAPSAQDVNPTPPEPPVLAVPAAPVSALPAPDAPSPAPTVPVERALQAAPVIVPPAPKPSPIKPSRTPRTPRAARVPRPAPGKPRRKKRLPPDEPKKEEAAVAASAPAVEPAKPNAPPAGGEKPAPAADAPEEGEVLLPGMPRPLPPKSAAKTKSEAAPTTPAAPAPDAAAAAAPEDSTAHQIREQFEFCAQLLSQGAYADHFDTCLCVETRQALPYRGRRDFYAETLKKAEKAGALEAVATVTDVALEGAAAKVAARWRTAAAMTKGTVRTETWRLEDGLWCRAP